MCRHCCFPTQCNQGWNKVFQCHLFTSRVVMATICKQPFTEHWFPQIKQQNIFHHDMIAIETSPGSCVEKPKASGGLMHLTASGRPIIQPSQAAMLEKAKICISQPRGAGQRLSYVSDLPRPWAFQHSCIIEWFIFSVQFLGKSAFNLWKQGLFKK